MFFEIDFEHEASDGQTYFIEVKGNKFFEDEEFTEITNLAIYNELGEEIDTNDPIYNELAGEAFDRDYEIEMHETDTSYYGDHNELY